LLEKDLGIPHPKWVSSKNCFFGGKDRMTMKLADVQDILQAVFLFDDGFSDRRVVYCCGSDIPEDMLALPAQDSLLLTGDMNEQLVPSVKFSGVTAVVFVRGKFPDERIVSMARRVDLPLLATPCSMFVASGRLYLHGLRGVDS
jgi:hypothetical protein